MVDIIEVEETQDTSQKLDGRSSLYRMAALIGTFLSMLQTSIWIILCLIAIIYFMMGAPFSTTSKSSVRRYGYIFSQVYFNRNAEFQSCANVSAAIFFVLNWIYMFLSIHVLVASKIAYCELRIWTNPLLIRERTLYWIIASGLIIGFEGVVGLFFLRDYAICTLLSDSDTAAAAMTIATLVMKGFLMWIFNLTMVVVVLVSQYVKCPVTLD